MNTELLIFVAIGFIVGLIIFRKKSESKDRVFYPVPEDNPCRPHQWSRMADIIPADLATDVVAILKERTDLKGSLIDTFASSLTCKHCGYMSGTEIMIDLQKFPEVVSGFVFTEKERALAAKYLTKKHES